MADFEERRLPVGIQSFKEIRRNNYAYVDKTEIVWNLVNRGKKYNYLSRPRRFGKSLLVDTLQTYFEGRSDLFEGLKIMNLEKEWKKSPVIRLDRVALEHRKRQSARISAWHSRAKRRSMASPCTKALR